MMNPLSYTNAEVRDLAWSLASPPLLQRQDAGVHWPDDAWFTAIGHEFGDTLRQLDADPQPLRDLLARRKDQRLGNYFEVLWRYWLDHNPRYALLHANLPVRNHERTLGEFDLIVQDRRSGAVLHWELAVKFYLGCADTGQAANWWGPGRRDRLDIKTDHLLHHQTRLSRHPQAQALLAELGLRIDATWLIMKGRLFYPCGRTTGAPSGANPRHVRGFWVHGNRLDLLRPAHWLILERHQWLAPLQRPTAPVMDSRELREWWRDDPHRRPVCVAAIVEGVEVERGFVVPEDWEAGDDQPL
jgi:hypothetical protein